MPSSDRMHTCLLRQKMVIICLVRLIWQTLQEITHFLEPPPKGFLILCWFIHVDAISFRILGIRLKVKHSLFLEYLEIFSSRKLGMMRALIMYHFEHLQITECGLFVLSLISEEILLATRDKEITPLCELCIILVIIWLRVPNHQIFEIRICRARSSLVITASYYDVLLEQLLCKEKVMA